MAVLNGQPEGTPQVTRVYPINCTSAYCGRANCTGCCYLSALDEFRAWARDNNARVEDEIWAPLVWTIPRSST